MIGFLILPLLGCNGGERGTPAEPVRLDGSTSTGPLVELLLATKPELAAARSQPEDYVQSILNPKVVLPTAATRSGEIVLPPPMPLDLRPNPERRAELRRKQELLDLPGARAAIGYKPSGTNGSYTNLIGGDADLILVARRPSESELAEADAAGVTLDVHPVARDAFVFLVNQKAPAKAMTLDQARAIFLGEITSWADLGGPDERILAYHRQPDSGSRELFDKLVLGDGTIPKDMANRALLDMLGPIERVSVNHDVISYSVFFYAKYMVEADSIQLAAINGVTPDPVTIHDGTYPLVTNVYVAVRASDEPAAANLMAWLRSSEGQALVERSGYVPLLQGSDATD